MDKDLVKSVRRAANLLDKLYGDSDHLYWTYMRYANTKVKLNSNTMKSVYFSALGALLMMGLVSNLRMLFRWSTQLWLTLLALIVVGAVCLAFYNMKNGKKKAEREFELAREDYEAAAKPFIEQINASRDLKLIPPQYQYPKAADYILDQLQNDSADTVEEAVQKFEVYFDELAGRSDHEEFRDTKEQEQSVKMFYPDLDIKERYERKSTITNRDSK